MGRKKRVGKRGDLINPVQSLGHLLAHARDRKITLKHGDIVSAGTLTQPFELPVGNAEVVARYLDAELRMRTQVAQAMGTAK